VIAPRVVLRALAAAALAIGGLVALGAGTAGSGGVVPATAGTETARHASAPPAWQLPANRPAGGYLIGRVTGPLRTTAGVVMPHTALGNETWLLIVRHHGQRGTALIPTGGRPARAVVDLTRLRLRWTPIHVDIDLGTLRLRVLAGRRVLGSFPVAAGMPATPTPTGSFSVTDRVRFPAGSSYGTFALGLSAHQDHVLPGWPGGDQIAIHGTAHPDSIGHYASLGCIRVPVDALRMLRRVVPLGAPVVIHP
jgi:lipoprotein-anchoring transpeptidase ErfK/SrfK